MKHQMNLNHICKIMSIRHSLLLARTSLFISSAEKIESAQEFKMKPFK